MYNFEEYLFFGIIYVLWPISLLIIPIVSTMLYRKNRKALVGSLPDTSEVNKTISPVAFCLIMFLAEVPILLVCIFGLLNYVISDWAWIIIVIDLIMLPRVGGSLYKTNISSRLQESVNSEDSSQCMSIEQFPSKIHLTAAIAIMVLILSIGAYAFAVMMSV